MKELPVEDEEPYLGSGPGVQDEGGDGVDTGIALLETRKGMCYLAPLGVRDVGYGKIRQK